MSRQVIVVTRFNLAIKTRYHKVYKKTSEGYKAWLDEEYLAKRFDLFDRYTYPSFCAQTDHDYRWLVLFHKDTPERFVSIIRKYEKDLGEFEPVFLDDESDRTDELDQIHEYLKEHLNTYFEKDGIVTVRVDNDDAVHPQFIEKIKTGFAECLDTSALSFPNGLQYDSRSRKCMRYKSVNNHFSAVFASPNDRFMSVFSFRHFEIDRYIDKDHRIIVKTTAPMWVEIVHDSNCVNEIWSRPSKVFVPYDVRELYPFLDVKWNTRGGWIAYILAGLPVAFFKMFIDVIRIFVNQVRTVLEVKNAK